MLWNYIHSHSILSEHKRTEQVESSDEDAGIDMTLDNCSEGSMQSDLKSNNEEPGKSICLMLFI